MPFTDSDLRALEPREKQYRVATGDGLYVVVYPNGSKYFTWVYRYPPGRGGQQRWHHIGPYGKGSGKWSLKAAREGVFVWTNCVGRRGPQGPEGRCQAGGGEEGKGHPSRRLRGLPEPLTGTPST